MSEEFGLRLNQDGLKGMKNVEIDKEGNVRYAKIDMGKILRNEEKKNQDKTGIDITIVDKNIENEPCNAAPITFDTEYKRNSGYGVITFYDK